MLKIINEYEQANAQVDSILRQLEVSRNVRVDPAVFSLDMSFKLRLLKENIF